MTTVEVPGAELYVERAGEGPVLLSISGSGSSLSEGMGPAALPLSKAFDVVGWDHRGLGRSVSAEPAPTMADFAADAMAIADALGHKEFAVFGVSFGGMVALELAVTVPERVTRLVLACTSAGGAGGSSYPLHERPGPSEMAALIDSRPEVAEAILSLMSGRTEPAEPGYSRQLAARRRHDVWDRLHLVSCPTLVASGRYDGIAPVANSEAIASRIARAVHRTYDGGHAFLFQDPQAWPDIVEFLSSESESRVDGS